MHCYFYAFYIIFMEYLLGAVQHLKEHCMLLIMLDNKFACCYHQQSWVQSISNYCNKADIDSGVFSWFFPHLFSSSGVSTFTFFEMKCCLSRWEPTRNPTRENTASIVQNTWNELMLSLSQNWYDRNTDSEPHPLNTEQYQLRVALSSDDKARSARRARWFKSIIVKKPSYKQRQKTNWIEGWHQRNQMHKNETVKSGPYFNRAL